MSHPIIPPLKLVTQWMCAAARAYEGDETWLDVATQAARWGADQELEACVEWLNNTDVDDSQEAAKDLRAARRPKPPSLAEQALEALQQQIDKSFKICPEAQERADLIRAALERLQQFEQENQTND